MSDNFENEWDKYVVTMRSAFDGTSWANCCDHWRKSHLRDFRIAELELEVAGLKLRIRQLEAANNAGGKEE